MDNLTYFPDLLPLTERDENGQLYIKDHEAASELLNGLPFFNQLVAIRRYNLHHRDALADPFVHDWVLLNQHHLPESEAVFKALKEQLVATDPVQE